MDILITISAALLCLIGLILSSLGFSGTWIVLFAALITRFAAGFPNIGTLVLFVLLCITAEALEAFAGFFGVHKRGGSKAAGAAAVLGGLIGAAVGSAVFPILGTLLGMLAGSFAAAFAVEWKRLRHHRQAAGIASGAVIARLGVLLLKTVITLIMIIHLVIFTVHTSV